MLQHTAAAAADTHQAGGGAGGGEVIRPDDQLVAAGVAAAVARRIQGRGRHVVGLAGGEGVAPLQGPAAGPVVHRRARLGTDADCDLGGAVVDRAAQQGSGVEGVEGIDADQGGDGVDRQQEGARKRAGESARAHNPGGVGEVVGAGGFLQAEVPGGGVGGGGCGGAHL